MNTGKIKHVLHFTIMFWISQAAATPWACISNESSADHTQLEKANAEVKYCVQYILDSFTVSWYVHPISMRQQIWTMRVIDIARLCFKCSFFMVCSQSSVQRRCCCCCYYYYHYHHHHYYHYYHYHHHYYYKYPIPGTLFTKIDQLKLWRG